MSVTICILGNIGAGKTSISSMLRERLDSFALLIMDEYRRKYNLYTTIIGENTAFEVFLKDTIALDYIIVEASGVSKNFHKIEGAVKRKGGVLLKIYLYAPKKILLDRVAKRERDGYKRPPFPYNQTIDKSIDYIAKAWTMLPADMRIDTSKLSPLSIVNYIMAHETMKLALKENDKARISNAWFYEKNTDHVQNVRYHPEGTMLIEVAIRLLRNGQSEGNAFTIMMCKKDGTLRRFTNIVRASKQMHYDVDTKMSYQVYDTDENLGINKFDWRDMFLYSLDEKKNIRLVTSRLMFLNNKRIWH